MNAVPWKHIQDAVHLGMLKQCCADATCRGTFRAAGPEMQRVFGFRMLGRFFNAEDTASTQPIAVGNRAL